MTSVHSHHPGFRSKALYRRRGGTFVFFLGSATLVSIIAISALTVMRINLQSAVESNQLAIAQANAQSAVEQGILAIYTNSSWRTSIAHNTWSTPQAIAGGTMSWKLVDDANGNLTSDRNARIRVHGKGVQGSAVWVLSVQIQPPPESIPSSRLTNGDFESGVVTPWTNQGSATLGAGTGPHAGTYCGRLSARAAGTAAAQPISNLNSGETLQVSAWIAPSSTPDNAWIGVRIVASSGTQFLEAYRVTISATAWTELVGTVTPTWTGTLTSATLLVGTDGSGDFKCDDASLKVIPSQPGLIPGSWKREAQ